MKALSAAFAVLVLICAAYASLQPSFAQPASVSRAAPVKAAPGPNEKLVESGLPQPPSKVESLAVKQRAAPDDIGDARDYETEPGNMNMPPMKGSQPPQIEFSAGRFPVKGVAETATTTTTATTVGPPPPVAESPLRNRPPPKQNTISRAPDR